MKLRDFRPGDLGDLARIDEVCFPPGIAYTAEQMDGLFRHPGLAAAVAETSRGAIAGFVAGHKLEDGRGLVVTLDVLPRYRRRGIGRSLLTECENRLRQMGVAVVELETAVGNTAGRALYRSAGYAMVKVRKRYYPNGEDALVMEKALMRPKQAGRVKGRTAAARHVRA